MVFMVGLDFQVTSICFSFVYIVYFQLHVLDYADHTNVKLCVSCHK